jgi:hypothetical protein
MPNAIPPKAPETPDEIFRPIKWIYDPMRNGADADLQCAVKDVARGIETILLMTEFSDVEESNNDPALFDNYTRGCLIRLAIRSLDLLASTAEAAIDKSNDAYLAKNAGGRNGKK